MQVIRATVGVRNQQYLYPRVPTVVAKLLQYCGVGSNTGMVFFIQMTYSELKTGEFNLDFKVW